MFFVVVLAASKSRRIFVLLSGNEFVSHCLEILCVYIISIFTLTTKGGLYKFCKSQIRKFADLNNLSDLRTFRICGIADLRFADPVFFVICGLKLPQVRKYKLFLLTNTAFNAPVQFCTQYKNRLKRRLLGLFGRLAIHGLAHLRNLRICDSGMKPRIWGFAV